MSIGEHQEAANMCMGKASSSTKPNDAITLLWKPFSMRWPTLSANGQQSRSGGKSLEQHSQTDDSPDSRAILEGQLRECFGRVVYSHKAHEKCADILLSRLDRIKL
jgi:hypothetical protein